VPLAKIYWLNFCILHTEDESTAMGTFRRYANDSQYKFPNLLLYSFFFSLLLHIPHLGKNKSKFSETSLSQKVQGVVKPSEVEPKTEGHTDKRTNWRTSGQLTDRQCTPIRGTHAFLQAVYWIPDSERPFQLQFLLNNAF